MDERKDEPAPPPKPAQISQSSTEIQIDTILPTQSEPQTEDLVDSFKVMRMEESDSVKGNSSTPSSVSTSTQGEGLSRESNLPSNGDTEVIGMASPNSEPVTTPPVSSPEETSKSEYSSSISDSEEGMSEADYWDVHLMISSGLFLMELASAEERRKEEIAAKRAEYSKIFGDITFTFYDAQHPAQAQQEQSSREGGEPVEEQSTNTIESSESTQSNILIPTEGEGTEITTSDNLGTCQSATEMTSTHQSTHSEGNSRVWSIEEATESMPLDHSAIPASAQDGSLSDNISDEQPQTSQLCETEEPTSTSPTSEQYRAAAKKKRLAAKFEGLGESGSSDAVDPLTGETLR